MVQSKAADVDAYLAELPDDRREAVAAIREICLEELPGFTEVMAHGMPCLERDGAVELGYASQKRHISLYVLREDVREAFAERLAGHDTGKGCLRFSTPAKVARDLDLIRDLVRAFARTPGPVC
ncbi:iron chaperone [Glycomyces harbinensis]|uniref:Uncharacterized conserved protein YdhG, YjbR/CyaY-like superfamily, DUF1801 family n=1 Tax=Glycomyces harbinensis TaxID=58114 RepID=A0A1G6WR20_9ACTN|nr:DUF1801 domain-containing protein [Glycomyces harbinensis]SDD67546.1 Uncharacterized conserved protein YdhG, YjbR/CyaY-like superfamily, DUF1801 family [Glycomyces harbinensis]